MSVRRKETTAKAARRRKIMNASHWTTRLGPLTAECPPLIMSPSNEG